MEHSTIEIFSTCIQSNITPCDQYLARVADVSRWSESYGCKGILVYTDNSLVDPWLVSQVIIQSTSRLCPLVAVQPIYLHPYSVAKLVASFAFLHGRQLYLNMVAGGFTRDLAALNDLTPHDKRYDRLVEYTTIIQRLTGGTAPFTYKGDYYSVENLSLAPAVLPEMAPVFFVSGSSDSGLGAARQLGATAIMYPRPPSEYAEQPLASGVTCGIRVGIIARESDAEAWMVAHQRFPQDRKGQLAQQMAMKVSDSKWHRQLSALAQEDKTNSSPYWLWPFENYKSFCPYIVGSYKRVEEEIERYVALGARTFILDVPPTEEELFHTCKAFSLVHDHPLVWPEGCSPATLMARTASSDPS